MSSALQQLMDAIDAAGLERPEDFVLDARGLLELAISMLPADAREVVLQDIEDGSLRSAVARYSNAAPEWAAKLN
jgi:hypothetical protein